MRLKLQKKDFVSEVQLGDFLHGWGGGGGVNLGVEFYF